MLPIALTCPLWWVARWATRVLTSLAVVAALALGAGPASAATPTLSAGPSSVPTLSAVPTAAQSAQVAPEGAAETSSRAWSVDSQPALPAGRGTVAAAGVLPVCAAGADRLPLVDAPSSRAPRAPPGR
ncbi:hypothetical protein [Micromonospora sp. NPDC005413]|uniref:hypothetical protein n=1 Tax=Micromonospora sp. NPDC005413 TaxID=3154563 RepID=UPI0033BBE0AB